MEDSVHRGVGLAVADWAVADWAVIDSAVIDLAVAIGWGVAVLAGALIALVPSVVLSIRYLESTGRVATESVRVNARAGNTSS